MTSHSPRRILTPPTAGSWCVLSADDACDDGDQPKSEYFMKEELSRLDPVGKRIT